MPLMDDIDNAIFFDALGDEVTIIVDDGSLPGKPLPGIYVKPFEAVSNFDGTIASCAPGLRVADSDLAITPVEPGQGITVNGTAYIVKGIEPDDEGWTVLDLRERFD